jgi:hypothetical protein
MDGEVLAQDGEVLDKGWCSTGSNGIVLWIGQFCSGNAAGKVGSNLEEIKTNGWLCRLI